jgi:hypothetical protein
MHLLLQIASIHTLTGLFITIFEKIIVEVKFSDRLSIKLEQGEDSIV